MIFFPNFFQASRSPVHFLSYSGSLISGKTNGQSLSFSTASIKVSEIQTERLAPLILLKSCFTVINSSISGCQSQSISMVAPLLVPPCWTTSCVAYEKSPAHVTGPDEVPLTFRTRAPRLRKVRRRKSRENHERQSAEKSKSKTAK